MQDDAIIRRVRDEHERLREITDALNNALKQGGGDVRAWLGNVCKSFEHFRAHLIHRIALEEIGGFLDYVVEKRPDLVKQVEHLKEGHAKMIEMAGATLAHLKELSTSDADPRGLACTHVKIMLSEVDYHEEVENLLVVSVFNDDIGVGD
ncbi:MAG: hemerythrin domain-containing protein [Phycisphaerales bacterium]|nr:hemerythrin domain-containing protein [Phycisphaerales bacterium]